MRAALLVGVIAFGVLGFPRGARADEEPAPPEKTAAEKEAEAKALAEREAAEKEAAELVRRYARERLLQKARDTVDPSRRAVGALDDTRQSLVRKRELYSRINPDAWRTLEMLLGPLIEQGTSEEGLIRQAALFYRWMHGGKESQEVPSLSFVDLSGRGLEVINENGQVEPERLMKVPVDSDLITNEVLADWTLKQERDKEWAGQVVITGIDQLRAVQEPMIQLALTRPDELHLRYSQHYVDTRQRQVGPRVAELKADVPSAGLVSAAAVRSREERAQRMREKADRILAMQEGVRRSLDRLVKLEKALTRESGGLGFEIEEARNAFDKVKAELAEAEAAEKAAEEARQKAEEEARKKAAEEAGEDPDENAPAEDDGQPLPTDEETGDDAPAEDEVEDPVAALHPAELALEKLRLREILDAQKLRLLYIAVRRADLRMTLLDGVLNQVKEEAVAAEDAHQRFVIALATIRRERQMDRLKFEETELRLDHTKAHRIAREGPEAERPLWGAYDRALEALIEVNKATIAGVKMRRDLEARTQPLDEAALEGCLPGEEGHEVPEEGAEVDALARFRTCRAAALDPIYVKDALTMIDHPEWDSIMTARHYEAVDDRIADLESALTIIESADALQADFDKQVTGAKDALGEVETLSTQASNWWEWRVRLREARAEWLLPNEKAFQETMRGVRDELGEVKADIETYREFRSRLLQLGTRSFRVRVQRKLDTDKLAAAYDDSLASLQSVGLWVSGQSEDNLGAWIQRNWKLLLACLGCVLVSFVLLVYGRRWLDHLLKQMARSVAALKAEPVAVGAELQAARIEKARAEMAARAEEEAALAEVSKGEHDKAQRMGEGGYGGGG